MNKLKHLIIGAAMMFPLTSFAGDFPWLTFLMTDNTEISVAADNLTINYSNRTLQLKSETIAQEIPVDQIKTMRFTSYLTGLDNVSGDNLSGKTVFYNTSGIKAGDFVSVEEARRSLPSGIYIVRNNNKKFKVIF